jgi:hypothetical protein
MIALVFCLVLVAVAIGSNNLWMAGVAVIIAFMASREEIHQ